MIDRFEPVDWYADNRPRRFRDNQTGEEISLGEYRKRRKIAAAIDEEQPDEQDEQFETQAFPEAPPQPRLFAVPNQDDGDRAAKPAVRRMGLVEMLAPAIAGVGESVARYRMRESPRQVFIPPREVTTPIIAPLGRIADRHLPVEWVMLMGEDGKDISECLGGLGASIVWFNEALKSYEDYRVREREWYAQRDRTGNSATTPADTTGSWAGDLFQRTARGERGTGMGDAPANGTADAPTIRVPSGDEAVSRVHDLLSADAEGIMRRGLDATR